LLPLLGDTRAQLPAKEQRIELRRLLNNEWERLFTSISSNESEPGSSPEKPRPEMFLRLQVFLRSLQATEGPSRKAEPVRAIPAREADAALLPAPEVTVH